MNLAPAFSQMRIPSYYVFVVIFTSSSKKLSDLNVSLHEYILCMFGLSESTYVWTYVYMCIYIYACMCIYICINVHMYICTDVLYVCVCCRHMHVYINISI